MYTGLQGRLLGACSGQTTVDAHVCHVGVVSCPQADVRYQWGLGASQRAEGIKIVPASVHSRHAWHKHYQEPLPYGTRVRRETYVKAEVGESPNDRNDRAIRTAAAWYAARLPGMRVVVLTNDADNRRRALEAGLQAMSVQARWH